MDDKESDAINGFSNCIRSSSVLDFFCNSDLMLRFDLREIKKAKYHSSSL